MTASISLHSHPLRVAILGLGLLLLACSARAQELPFSHYTTESSRNPLPSAAVTGVYQDALGYLWFSVYSTGLVRYDGGQMETIAAGEGLADLGVQRLVEDARGRLWVASRGGVVVSTAPLPDYAPGEQVRFVSIVDSVRLPDTHVNSHALAADTSGAVWVGAAGSGLVRMVLAEGTVSIDTVRASSGDYQEVTAVLTASDESVWFSTLDGSLYRVSPGELVADPVDVSLGHENQISALTESREGVLWAGTHSGRLLRLDRASGRVRVEMEGPARGAMITDITDDPRGDLWIGTEGAGLFLRDAESGRESHFTYRNGLLSATIHEIAVDAEGNLWFAQLGGVSRLRHNFEAFQNYSANSHRGEQPVLPSASVGAVAVGDGEGLCAVWAATSEGGIVCIAEDGSSSYVQSADGLRNDWVNALAIDEAGALWIGSQYGIQRLNPGTAGGGRAVRVGDRPAQLSGYGPGQVSIFTISRTRIPTGEPPDAMVEGLWFGGWDLFARIEGQWYLFGAPSGLPQARFHGVAFDDAGHLWVSTQGEGIYRTREPFTTASLEASERSLIALPNEEGGVLEAIVVRSPIFAPASISGAESAVRDVYRMVWLDGRMWTATAEGLLALSPAGVGDSLRVMAQLGREDGLGADFTMSLDFAPRTRTLWVGTNGGLSEVDPVQPQVLRTLTAHDGLIGNEGWYTGSVVVSEAGTVYFGSARGLSSYDPSADQPSNVPPRVRLRSAEFTSDGGNYTFTAEYAGLSFVEETRVRYRTRLVGYDGQWSAPHAEDRIRYTNLPAVFLPRAYTLEVIAENGNGTWTRQPLQYRFMVPPPPWLRWWAMVLYAIVLVAGVMVIYRAQHARLMRKERERARLREADLRAETAFARSEAAEAASRALQEENKRKEAELEKARELEQAYHVLKMTQAQLVQSEKLASLGQLTAGIAHEIKNPLNFVTNFAALTREVADELMEQVEEAPDVPLSGVRDDLEIIQMNARKIEEHGLRADGIVRSMLEHSRGGPGERAPTDINALVEQYVNLAYHGEKARSAGFDLQIERDYDPNVGNVTLVQQELGRVLVNLLDNAFYAVHQKSLSTNGQSVPTVAVTTRDLRDRIEIRIADNGSGIPEDIKQKIFEPFFTTKPTGKGTGLGLSLSHNIIVQGFGGEMHVESEDGEGTTFLIRLPREAVETG